ncbi:MAG: colicin D domain-containing protein [Jatrophihabitans sp.]|uniref:colicin D domain-containing protein n=1 Tax=Jatrophihabitans sp. TaxID=1932789 RepID=UPI003F7E4809
MGPTIDVTPERFGAASRVVGALIGEPANDAARRLVATLSGCAGMAGDDPVGRDWGSTYDAAASATLGATRDVVDAGFHLAALLQKTGFNWAGAEIASVPGVRWTQPDTSVWRYYRSNVPDAPSSFGVGSAGLPPHWHLISDVIDRVWPNGHQDKLRTAATAWAESAALLDDLAGTAPLAEANILAERTPETDAALSACRSLGGHLSELAAAHRVLSSACTDYAHLLDQLHHEVIGELESLVEWTAGIEIAGGLFSVITVGLSEAAAQAAELARIALTARSVAAIIDRIGSLIATCARTMQTAVETAGSVNFRLRALLDAGYARVTYLGVDAGVMNIGRDGAALGPASAEQAALPPLQITRKQIEKKFDDHAPAMGIETPKSRQAYQELERAIEHFVDDPATIRIPDGTYRDGPAILNVNYQTEQIVIQHSDGRFWTCWKMKAYQIDRVRKDKAIGIVRRRAGAS